MHRTQDAPMDVDTLPELSAPANRTLSDHITRELRTAILTGQLRPGQRIVEHEIARSMHTSRGPVRDALQALEIEQLVVRYPHKGTFVAWLSRRDADEIYSLREAIEMLAVEYIISHASDAQIDELAALVESMADHAQGDYDAFQATDIDLDFHQTLCRISGHRRLLTAWEALSPQIRMILYQHRARIPDDFRERGVQWHRDIVDALRNRDVALARELIRKHVAVSFQTVRDAIPDEPE
jgi:DNA-binding GntR family transcriptional regulator